MPLDGGILISFIRPSAQRIQTLWANLVPPKGDAPLPRHTRAVKACLPLLYQWLVQPVEAALLRDGVFPASLTISGDSVLYGLPWEMLTNAQGQQLIELTTVNLIPTPRDLVRLHSLELKKREAQGSAASGASRSVVLGIEDFGEVASQEQAAQDTDSGPDANTERGAGNVALRGLDEALRSASDLTFSVLNWAVQEAQEVAKLLDPAPILLTPQAADPSKQPTRRNFQEQVNRPRVLHVATHSDVLTLEKAEDFYRRHREQHPHENLVDSGMGVTLEPGHPFSRVILAFQNVNAGGLTEVLRAWEVAALPLQGTELVVFSSCKSGAVEASVGEGLAGLSTAAFLAGAERTISTLWEIEDQQAAVFIWNVYRHWVNEGGTVASAFHAVKRLCAEGHKLPQWPDEQGRTQWMEITPAVWAAFVMNGLPEIPGSQPLKA